MTAQRDLELVIDLTDAVDCLPRRQRMAVILYYGLGYTQAETAVYMGVSQPAVLFLLQAAKVNLIRGL